MERATYLRLIHLIAMELGACEREISTLAREVLCPSTTPARRTEVLILRAELQTRSVLLLRDIQRLESDFAAADHIDHDVENTNLAIDPPKKQPRSEPAQEAIRLYPCRSAYL